MKKIAGFLVSAAAPQATTELTTSARDKEMIVATGTFVPAEKMLFEHRRNGLMEPYEATLAKISFANDQSFRGNILEAQRQRCGICSDSVGIAGGHFRYLATPQ